jgi:zinc protease
VLSDNVHRHVLPNGLTLLIKRDAAAPVVAVVTHVRAGYFDEPDEWVGIAHVLEHMFFKGTARRGVGDIARDTQALGGYLNAGTIYDKTYYYTVLPSAGDGLTKALDIQADALMHAALDAGELGRELEVIIQEAKRKLDNPGAVTVETLYESLFKVHRMRRWRIGKEAELRRLTADDLRAYYQSRYTPSRVIVGLVGDLDPEKALALASETYGSWRRPVQRFPMSPVEPPAHPSTLRVLTGDVERPMVSVGWRTVGTLHPDTPALDVASAVLGMGRGSWLQRSLRQPGLAASAHASHYTPTEVGVFEIGFTTDLGHVDEATRVALDLAGRLASDGPAPHDLERCRAIIAVQRARRSESMDAAAEALCEGEAQGDYRLVDEMDERVLAVNADDVRRVALQYLAGERVCGVMYLPTGGSTALSNLPWPPAGRGAAGSAPPAAVRWPVRPLAAPRSTSVAGVTCLTLPAGEVLAQPKPGAGLVALGLYVPAFRESEPADAAGISWLLARAGLRGAAGYDAETLALAAERLGGSIGLHVGLDAVGVEITVRPDAVVEAGRLLAAVLREPTLDPDQVALERDLLADDAARTRDDMGRYPLQRVLAAMFPGDVYGRPGLGDPDGVRALTRERLRAWQAELLGRRALVVAVGDLPHEQLAGLAASALIEWPGRGAPVLAPPPSAHAGRGSEERAKAQSALAMAFPAPPYGSADRPALEVLCAVLSGMSGRLFDALREQKSLAYTVSAMPWQVRRAGAVLAYIATSPERENEAREGLLAELARIAKTPPAAAEVARARSYAAGMLDVGRQSSRAIANGILDAHLNGVLRDLPGEADRLRAVTAEQVGQVASAIFDEKRRAEFVVRGTGAAR